LDVSWNSSRECLHKPIGLGAGDHERINEKDGGKFHATAQERIPIADDSIKSS
jgi:hypothetical protein